MSIAGKVQAAIEPVVAELGYELVDVEYVKEGGRWILRIYIDRAGGVGLDDCERVSRAIDPILDNGDWVDRRYYLEVSSPGLERPLKRPADYERFAGQHIYLKTFAPVSGRRVWRGRLEGRQGDMITIIVEGEDITIPLANIALARLEAEVQH